jgi:hypothetical protein
MRKKSTNQRTGQWRNTDTYEYMHDRAFASDNVRGRNHNFVCPLCGFNAGQQIQNTPKCPVHKILLEQHSCKFEIPRKGSNKFKNVLKTNFKFKQDI